MPADLYTRYMGATDRWGEHAAGCGACSTTRPGCLDGTRLWERLSRLQDAYLTHLREKRGTS